jgi:hypothetical protein
MLMTRSCRRETLVIELVGKGLFRPLAASGSPYRSAAGVDRPTGRLGGRLLLRGAPSLEPS